MARSGESLVTRDHGLIRNWAEQRGGVPSIIGSTRKKSEGVGVLRIDFPGYSGESSLNKISWDEFFDTFERKNLSFLYQETTRDGKESRFFKFVGSDAAEGAGERQAAGGGEDEEEEDIDEDEFPEDEDEEMLDDLEDEFEEDDEEE